MTWAFNCEQFFESKNKTFENGIVCFFFLFFTITHDVSYVNKIPYGYLRERKEKEKKRNNSKSESE